MKAFADLYRQLDGTTSTNRKLAALADYFRSAPAADAAWAVYFLSGNRLKRLINTRLLREWLAQLTGYPAWLVEETYQHVGDLAETLALLLDEPADDDEALPLHQWIEQRLRPLARLDDEAKRERVVGWWRRVPVDQRFVLNKLMTGAFRVGVSRRLVTRALADVAELDAALIAHRLMGDWQPTETNYHQLLDPDPGSTSKRLPYPFFLASPLEQAAEELGSVSDWSAEWKWDGIRAQLIRRGEILALWSRGEEALDGRFPEIEKPAEALPAGTVLDGEILAWRDGEPLPFNILQQRIGRKKVGPTTLAKAPTALLIYDLLEADGRDLREQPFSERRERLERIIHDLPEDSSGLYLSPVVEAQSWQALAAVRDESRDRGVEGLILKRRSSPYRVGRVRGDWWKWKVDPYTIDAVLLYAQPGHGRRANLLTDYTFAVWRGEDLVPIAKAYSGLSNPEIDQLDKWIRRHTRERFGPVRSVEPSHVFELAFEGINRSSRHKSGVALRFPRIHRWRTDLAISDADRIEDLERLLPAPD